MSIDFRIELSKLPYLLDLLKLWILEEFFKYIFKITHIILS